MGNRITLSVCVRSCIAGETTKAGLSRHTDESLSSETNFPRAPCHIYHVLAAASRVVER